VFGWVLGGACASSPEGGGTVGDLTGCYQFERTAEARELGLPWGFELLGGALSEWPNLPEGRRARTRVTAERTADHPFAFWRPVAGDSIQVGHPGGGGFALSLVRDGRVLRGTARAVGDAVRFGESFQPRDPRPVVAWKVVCPDVASSDRASP
jgi:hypothetical protein